LLKFVAADEGVPIVLLHHLKHNQVLHETAVLLTIRTEEVPVIADAQRVSVESLPLAFYRVIGRYGFMEEPDAQQVLARAAELGVPIDRDRIMDSQLESEPFRWDTVDRLHSAPDAAALAATYPRDHLRIRRREGGRVADTLIHVATGVGYAECGCALESAR